MEWHECEKIMTKVAFLGELTGLWERVIIRGRVKFRIYQISTLKKTTAVAVRCQSLYFLNQKHNPTKEGKKRTNSSIQIDSTQVKSNKICGKQHNKKRKHHKIVLCVYERFHMEFQTLYVQCKYFTESFVMLFLCFLWCFFFSKYLLSILMLFGDVLIYTNSIKIK